ncbi:cytochrome c4 [Sansalvadorimonas sp. 2012CJ34-2]|uniref:Cytochrome c4 n=1 Tax=Parendozoicomonas callyspongiae TaxID=2942213 RepID=A0ABT0PD49_9GAMM|nr:c-type cytochrome [Sansalvadorimonas sp. 2012CJ34-2]MCL6268468.1 cytochrome c4 [Sansalvadorimonas sp. 2012CJ34-2]
MKRIIVCLLVGLGWAGFAAAEGDAAAGKGKVALCTACHGPTGVSIAPNFPHLAGQGERYLTKQITDIKSGARPVPEMIGMTDNLSEQDIEDIAAFYASQTAPTGQATESSIEIGQKLYRGGDIDKGIAACTACHSPTGKGNDLAKFPMLAGQSPEYLAKQLRDFREGDRVNDGDSRIMRDTAEKLSNKQIDALASYISGLR